MIGPNKLACLSMSKLYSLAQCWCLRPGPYIRMELLNGASLRQATALLANVRLGWNGTLYLIGPKISICKKTKCCKYCSKFTKLLKSKILINFCLSQKLKKFPIKKPFSSFCLAKINWNSQKKLSKK
jgi:hypothetical protein